MPQVEQSRVVPYSPEEMFGLVADVERYPEFLPWLQGVEVLSRDDREITARFRVGYNAVRTDFTTRARLDPPGEIRLEGVAGLFSTFRGGWTFEPGDAGGTRVSFRLAFAFASGILGRLLRPLFLRDVRFLVRAFEQRARERYGAEWGPGGPPRRPGPPGGADPPK